MFLVWGHRSGVKEEKTKRLIDAVVLSQSAPDQGGQSCLYLNASVQNGALKCARSFFRAVLDPNVMRLWQDSRCFSFWTSLSQKINALAIESMSTLLHSRLWAIFDLNVSVPIMWKGLEVVIRFVPGYTITFCFVYSGADKSLTRSTSRCILFDGENISFAGCLVLYIYSSNHDYE
jgi:hypothetical protein